MSDVDKPMSNVELRLALANIVTKIEKATHVATAAKEAAERTNGLVADLQKWREQAMGAAKVTGIFFVTIILPLAAYLVSSQANEQERVQKWIDSTVARSNFSSIFHASSTESVNKKP